MDDKFQHQSSSQKISHLKKWMKFKSQSAKFLNSTNQRKKPNNSIFKLAVHEQFKEKQIQTYKKISSSLLREM